MNDSKSKEFRAFEKFCEIRGLELGSHEDRSPPEPDILAVVSGERTAYELTEAVEPAYARKLSDIHRTPQLVRDGYAALPAETKDMLDTRHHGKMIDPCFHDSISLRDRQAALGEIFDFILTIPPEFGSQRLERIENPLGMLDHIAMSQVGWNGICWEPGAPAGWIDPESALRERLLDKMRNKAYETEHPIELIIYLDRQIGPPPYTGWEDSLAEIAAQQLTNSPFAAVWLMDTWSDSVRQLAKI